MDKEEVIKHAIKFDASLSIKESWKKNGIEGTEELIKRLYSEVPTLRDYMLETHRELLKENSNG